MKNIVIGIPTFKRQKQLTKLVLSIVESVLDGLQDYNFHIVVVDNHKGQSAKSTVAKLQEACNSPFSLTYISYPPKGLSNVRNKILSEAYEFSPEYIAFVDDDEYVTPNWLMHLVQTAKRQNADFVLGHVTPIINDEEAKYLAPWFKEPTYDDQQPMNFIVTTGNLLMRTDFLKINDLKFDLRFNTSGGEDTFFGEQAVAKGGKLFWSQKAIVYEPITPKRASLKWLLKREFRGATTYTYIQKIKKDYGAIIKKIIVSCVYFVLGILTLPIVILPLKKRYWSLFTLANSFGGFAGLFSFTYDEYSSPE